MKIYLIEDNKSMRDNLVSTLEELAPVKAVGSSDCVDEGVAWLLDDQRPWDLAIVDLFLKSGSGLSVLEACRSRMPLQKIVVFSNYATHEMRLRCAQLGVDAVFDKATEIDALLSYCTAQSEKLKYTLDEEQLIEVA